MKSQRDTGRQTAPTITHTRSDTPEVHILQCWETQADRLHQPSHTQGQTHQRCTSCNAGRHRQTDCTNHHTHKVRHTRGAHPAMLGDTGTQTAPTITHTRSDTPEVHILQCWETQADRLHQPLHTQGQTHLRCTSYNAGRHRQTDCTNHQTHKVRHTRGALYPNPPSVSLGQQKISHHS